MCEICVDGDLRTVQMVKLGCLQPTYAVEPVSAIEDIWFDYSQLALSRRLTKFRAELPPPPSPSGFLLSSSHCPTTVEL
jgi:hypothetical protein